MTTNNTEVYTPEQIAFRLKTSIPYVKVLLRRGEIKGIKLGNRWRIDGRDFEEYINKKRGVM